MNANSPFLPTLLGTEPDAVDASASETQKVATRGGELKTIGSVRTPHFDEFAHARGVPGCKAAPVVADEVGVQRRRPD